MVRLKKEWSLFFLLLSLFILTRLFLLFTSPYIYFDAEYYIGAIAKELIDGADLKWYQLPWADYQGGNIINIYFTSFVYDLFGTFRYAIKVVPLVFSLIIFLTFYFLTRKFYSPFVNYSSTLILIFSPSVFIFSNLINGLGEFLQATMYSLLATLILFKIVINKNYKKRNFVLLGLICGFGFFSNYSVAIPLFISLITLILLFKFNIYTRLFLLFSLIGSLPFWMLNFIYLPLPSTKLWEIITFPSFSHFFYKLRYLILVEFRTANIFSINSLIIEGIIYEIIFLGSLIAVFIFIYSKLKQNSKKKLKNSLIQYFKYIYPVLFILLFFVAYSHSRVGDFRDGYIPFKDRSTSLFEKHTSHNTYYYVVILPFFFLLVPLTYELYVRSKLGYYMIMILIILGLISIYNLAQANGEIIFFGEQQQFIRNYCYKDCFSLNWQPNSPLPQNIIRNLNTIGYIFFTKYHNKPKGGFDRSYPIYLCSRLSTPKRRQECIDIVVNSFDHFYNISDEKLICQGNNELYNEVCKKMI